MQFNVRLFNPESGEVSESIAQGVSADALTLQYEQTGLVVLSLRKARGASRTGRTAVSSARPLDTAWWCRELRTLLQAGMTVVEALDTLKAQSLGPERQALHDQLVRCLQEGQSLSSAMQATGSFPAVLVAGVKASERTSTLVAALEDYLRYHELLDGLKRKVVSAAIYPCVVFGLGLVITVFLLLFVIPRFSRMYADRQSSIGGVTKGLLWVSQGLSEHGPAVAGAAAALAISLVWAWRQGLVERAAAGLLEVVGPLRRQVNEFRLAKLYQSMALMIRGGYAVSESLQQCAELKLHPGMREKLLRACAELEQGRKVSAVLVQAELTDTVTARLLTVGERTGNFDLVLQTIAQRHAANFSTFIERATRIVEPLMLLAASLLVGSVVLMMYMPVFDIAGSIR